ncbi:MAG: hypothetical protein DCE90_04210 [Pseudanabaena sp.]|nr:MAG: hypothetical protein DCE90_04210 [Pseudanabaena sp.]
MFDWQKLAQIRELTEYFESDFQGFKQRIEFHIQELQKIESEELDKLAIIRVLEVTNGCTQWAFRRNDENCLTVEQTRECMQRVIGFMNNQRIDLPSGRCISFQESTNQLMREIRQIYQDAFKKNMEDQEREYYALSVAQFFVYGRDRLNSAMDLVKLEFESLFSTYYIERGRKYIAPYVESISNN